MHKGLFDNHVHIGTFEDTFYSYEDVFTVLKISGVKGCIFSYFTPRFNNSFFAKDFFLASANEIRKALVFAKSICFDAVPLLWIDPYMLLGSKDLFFYAKKLEFRGFKIHPYLHDWSNSVLLDAIFEYASQNNKYVYIHTGQSTTDQPILFEHTISKYPNVKVHLAHCKEAKQVIYLMSKYENVFGDTAFCPKEAFREIANAGFRERMHFGTDFPVTHYYENMNNPRQVSLSDLIGSYSRTIEQHEFDLCNSD